LNQREVVQKNRHVCALFVKPKKKKKKSSTFSNLMKINKGKNPKVNQNQKEKTLFEKHFTIIIAIEFLSVS